MVGRPSLIALLAALVAFAGCAAPLAPLDDASPTAGTETDRSGPANPWGEPELAVAIVDESGSDRDYAPLVERAIAFWNDEATQHDGHDVTFVLADDVNETGDADVVVRFVDEIDQCGSETHTAGCAPYVTDGPIHRPVDVRVVAGLSADSTTAVLSHEFGHLLGLDHGDQPRAVMAAETVLTTAPQLDATDRALPWNNATLSVFVDDANVSSSGRDDADAQIGHALDYVARGADGTVPENVSFVRTDDPTDADITIRFVDDTPCNADAVSCFNVRGVDPDGDGALETYLNATITVSTALDRDAVGWHVGRWTVRALGVTDDEYPGSLRSEASFSERRSDWWR